MGAATGLSENTQKVIPPVYKFTGKERDDETGNDYFGARYYASTVGRFMTPDWASRPTAVPYAVFGDPQSLNLYGYVRNDPVSRADLDGHDMQCSTHVTQCRADLQKLAPGTRVDTDGTVHKPGSFRSAFNHLTGHGKGTALVSRLVDNPAMTSIAPQVSGTPGGQNPGAVKYLVNGVSSTTIFATYDKSGNLAVGSASSVDILGHELIHQDHAERGGQDQSLGVHFLSTGFGVAAEVNKKEEFRTVGFSPYVQPGDITENMIRKEQGESPRATYNAPKDLMLIPTLLTQ